MNIKTVCIPICKYSGKVTVEDIMRSSGVFPCLKNLCGFDGANAN